MNEQELIKALQENEKPLENIVMSSDILILRRLYNANNNL